MVCAPPGLARRIARRHEWKNSHSRRISEPLSLIFLIVSAIASHTHRVSRHVIRHSSAQRICAHTAGSEVNPAKDARIGDFRCRVREIMKRASSARAYFRGEAKVCVLSKRGGKDESRCSTHRGVGRRVLGMRRSAGQRVEPWLPQRVRIRGRRTRSDCRDRPLENVAVLAIPACDKRVGK